MSKLFKKTISGDREIYVGEIKSNFYTRRVKTKHLFKYIDPKTKKEILGWTVDKDACEQHIFKKCTYLVIKDTEKRLMYLISTQTFMQNAIPLRDRYFLPLDMWEKKKDHLPFKHIEVVERD